MAGSTSCRGVACGANPEAVVVEVESKLGANPGVVEVGANPGEVEVGANPGELGETDASASALTVGRGECECERDGEAEGECESDAMRAARVGPLDARRRPVRYLRAGLPSLTS